ncbi:MAG: protein TolQ [Proteobacteria bacterium]|nr:protein TolQ [Pseudomonadota bacterium]
MTPKTLTPTLSTWNLIAESGAFVKLILLLLLAASIMTWAIIWLKARTLKTAAAKNHEFTATFWNSAGLDEIFENLARFEGSPIANVFRSGYIELKKLPIEGASTDGAAEIANLTRALNRAHGIEVDGLEKYVDWLASTASAAPFVGLFGTVWGIMSSFQSIGAMGSASLAVVAPGISEALISTAVGLAAAIPAAIAYNMIVNRTRKISLEIENFSQEFVNMIQRSLLHSRKGAVPNGSESRPLA